jgi:signal transduction histidine kinase
MKEEAQPSADASAVQARSSALFHEHVQAVCIRADRIFAVLMMVQWVAAIGIALTLSPYAWQGQTQTVNVHVYAAVFLGGLISMPSIVLARTRPGWVVNGYVAAVSQTLWSALFIHLTGGRIETHFHVFGALAFLAIYREWRLLVVASVVVAGDHFLRGIFWPESVYGISSPAWWRFLEHAFWVAFEDTVLIFACLQSVAEMRMMAARQAEVEVLSERDRATSAKLRMALEELQASQDARTRAEKLAAVGQLAASVGHELRNPLAAVRGAASYLNKRITDPKAAGKPLSEDPRIPQFLGVIDRELNACGKIIGDLLDFARERKPALQLCPLRPLAAEVFGVVTHPQHVTLINSVPENLAVPSVDRDQFRQVLINLVQNAVEAMPEDKSGKVVVDAEGGGDAPWCIRIADDGAGMPEEIVRHIFEPLYTTKVKGTGLGLAIVSNIVTAHRGTLRVESKPSVGTTFTIELPPEGSARLEYATQAAAPPRAVVLEGTR